MSTAIKFMDLLKENDVLGAIAAIKEGLCEKARTVTAGYETVVAQQYGMLPIVEEKDEDEKEDEESDDEDDEKEDE